jgi:hypothetical protein
MKTPKKPREDRLNVRFKITKEMKKDFLRVQYSTAISPTTLYLEAVRLGLKQLVKKHVKTS